MGAADVESRLHRVGALLMQAGLVDLHQRRSTIAVALSSTRPATGLFSVDSMVRSSSTACASRLNSTSICRFSSAALIKNAAVSFYRAHERVVHIRGTTSSGTPSRSSISAAIRKKSHPGTPSTARSRSRAFSGLVRALPNRSRRVAPNRRAMSTASWSCRSVMGTV